MSKLTLSFFLSSSSDPNSSNAPSLQNFKWAREINNLASTNPQSSAFSLAPGESRTVFNGSRMLSQDGTTTYSITQKFATANTYVLTATGGLLPNFRSPREYGGDATTQVTVTVNGPLVTFTSTGGSAFAFTGNISVGDQVTIGNLFNSLNQGQFTVLSFTNTSLTVENESGVAEGPITLGAGFANQVVICSAAGVQINDVLTISGGFSQVTQGSYAVTSVQANSLEFYSTDVLPLESGIVTQAVAVYSQAKKFVYMESDNTCSMTINGTAAGNLSPFVSNNTTIPGIFVITDNMFSMTVTNTSLNTANIFVASVE